jgi:hypothetical protein
MSAAQSTSSEESEVPPERSKQPRQKPRRPTKEEIRLIREQLGAGEPQSNSQAEKEADLDSEEPKAREEIAAAKLVNQDADGSKAPGNESPGQSALGGVEAAASSAASNQGGTGVEPTTSNQPEAQNGANQPTTPSKTANEPTPTKQPETPNKANQPTTPSKTANEPTPTNQPHTKTRTPVTSPSGLSELERSLLEEMLKRGEITREEIMRMESERTASANEASRVPEEMQATTQEEVPKAVLEEKEEPPTQEKEAPEEKIEKPKIVSGENLREERKTPTGIEIASEEQKPRIVEERDYSLVVNHAARKHLIRQERVAGVVLNEESSLEKEAREQARKDILPPDLTPGKPLMTERERAAETARRIWERKQREASLFYKVKKFLGLAGRQEDSGQQGLS